jgi:hypothetical protein
MEPEPFRNVDRRDFLKLAGAASAYGISRCAKAASSERFVVILDPADAAASSGPAKRAAMQLSQALAAKGVTCEMASSADAAAHNSLCIVAAGPQSPLAEGFPKAEALKTADSFRLSPGRAGRTPALLVTGADVRGYVYGLLELADRARYGARLVEEFRLTSVLEEKPANDVRCVSRYFCSELEDKPWYYDKSFWTGYLDSIATNRFNRFTMAYGLEYDFPRGVTDDYLHLPYPYLVDLPAYSGVRVLQLAAPDGTRLPTPQPLSNAERDRNFEMLRFIAQETGARGLHFQLGIWTHAYQWTDSPNAYHRIEGLTPETHASYCRDALAFILKECPQIQGLTMRVHGESGIPEGSYAFWKTVFEAIPAAGREIEIDMHAKGVNQTMIDIAVATGMPVKLGAKYSAEHQSLGYQQADIRALEIPHENLTKTEATLFSLSSGSRSFTRYGYADFLQQGAKYRLLFRSWPGTQRHLISVDPEMAAAYSRSASFCGAAGLDLMEPLTFKGREGSGAPGGRCAYADASLNPSADWQKYEYYYRVWGRKLYNPDAEPETWRRYLRSSFGGGAIASEAALANASRILPLLTSAHLDSASNHDLWYEMPTNMPIVQGSEPSPYGDTPAPKIFGTVSPLDPQLFSTIVEYTAGLLADKPSAKYSPIEVAQWVEDCASMSRASLDEARSKTRTSSLPEFRRMEEDVLIQIGLGTFFAHKLRSAVLFEIWQQTGDGGSGKLALAHYQKAKDAWSTMAGRAAHIYRSDIGYGSVPKRRGHWSDRISGIDADLAAMQAKVQSGTAVVPAGQKAAQVIEKTVSFPDAKCAHTPPTSFAPGEPLALSLSIASSAGPVSVNLCFRHVNQAERWKTVSMSGQNGQFSQSIPAEYTNSEYALQYYFELEHGVSSASLYPGFNKTLSNQPYFAVAHPKA